MVQYNCEACGFSTTIKTHYTRHLTTKKHTIISGKIDVFKCIYCNKTFNKKSNLKRHSEAACKLMNKKKEVPDIQYNHYNIYNMSPIKFLNTFFMNNPPLKDVLNSNSSITELEMMSLKNAHSTGNKEFISYEIDKILKERNKRLIDKLNIVSNSCPNVMFSNDGSCRRFIAKGDHKWEFYTNDDDLDMSTSNILDTISKEYNAPMNLNKKERTTVNNYLKKINDWNTNKKTLLS
jgi:hypothetical protein